MVGEHVVLGANCRLFSHVVIDGYTRLGCGNNIFPFASIGLQTQDLKYKGGITHTQIGDHNTFREAVTVHSATGGALSCQRIMPESGSRPREGDLIVVPPAGYTLSPSLLPMRIC